MDAEKLTVRKSLDLNFFFLIIFGMWPPEFVRGTWKIYLYRVYSVGLQIIMFYMYMVTEIIHIISVFGDIEKTVEASFLFITHFVQMIKQINFYIMEKRIYVMIKELDSPMFNSGLNIHRNQLQRAMSITKRDAVIFLSLGASTVVLWAIFPVLDRATGWKLPLKAWYPFDTSTTPNFQLTYTYQIISVMINALSHISLDTVTSGVMALTGGQLDVLTAEISGISPESMPSQRDKKSESLLRNKPFNKELVDMEMKNKLIVCIKHHQRIISYITEGEAIFSICYFVQFLGGCLVVCITAFQLTLVPVSILYFSMILYQSCMLMEIFLYCYHGNEIMLKSSNLMRAAYESSWYKGSRSYNSLLYFLVERSKKPLIVSAGYYIPLCLPTFVSILRSSYSYFAVLQTIHNGN